MKALPLLLLGGAAVLIMAGGSKTKLSKTIAKGVFPAGEPWRIIRMEVGNGYKYIVEADLEMRNKWVTFSKGGMPMAFPSEELARQAVQKVADGDLLVDKRGEVST